MPQALKCCLRSWKNIFVTKAKIQTIVTKSVCKSDPFWHKLSLIFLIYLVIFIWITLIYGVFKNSKNTVSFSWGGLRFTCNLEKNLTDRYIGNSRLCTNHVEFLLRMPKVNNSHSGRNSNKIMQQFGEFLCLLFHCDQKCDWLLLWEVPVKLWIPIIGQFNICFIFINVMCRLALFATSLSQDIASPDRLPKHPMLPNPAILCLFMQHKFKQLCQTTT